MEVVVQVILVCKTEEEKKNNTQVSVVTYQKQERDVQPLILETRAKVVTEYCITACIALRTV